MIERVEAGDGGEFRTEELQSVARQVPLADIMHAVVEVDTAAIAEALQLAEPERVEPIQARVDHLAQLAKLAGIREGARRVWQTVSTEHPTDDKNQLNLFD